MKRLLILFLGCLLLCAMSMEAQPGSSSPQQGHVTDAAPQPGPPDLLQESKKLYLANDLAGAEIAAKKYLALQPESAEATYLLGRVLERENAPRDSLQWFTKAAKLSDPSSEDLRFVAMDYVLLDDYLDALHWLQRSLQADRNNAESWYDLGRASMMQGDFTTAEKALGMCLALHPRYVKAENNLGVVYEAQNRTSKAAEAYQQAIAWQQSEPRPNEQPLLNYGTLLLTQQRSAEALPLLAQAVEIAPGNVKCHEQLAHAFEQQHQPDKAKQQMEKAIQLEPGNAALHYQLGQMYRRFGDTEKSKQEIALSSQLYGTQSTKDR